MRYFPIFPFVFICDVRNQWERWIGQSSRARRLHALTQGTEKPSTGTADRSGSNGRKKRFGPIGDIMG